MEQKQKLPVGISIDKTRPNQPYRTRVRVGSKIYFVGRYKNLEDALKAREIFVLEQKRKQDREKDGYYR